MALHKCGMYVNSFVWLCICICVCICVCICICVCACACACACACGMGILPVPNICPFRIFARSEYLPVPNICPFRIFSPLPGQILKSGLTQNLKSYTIRRGEWHSPWI
ncbi:MAG: hypothetical protein SWX82_17755 [Cyanobacteriota bacterium]|nr:hypothetical protein [Cyanobacteriota bacterium]